MQTHQILSLKKMEGGWRRTFSLIAEGRWSTEGAAGMSLSTSGPCDQSCNFIQMCHHVCSHPHFGFFFPFLLLYSINLYLCLDFFMFKPVACSMFGNYLWTSVNKERSREAHGQKLYLLNVSDFWMNRWDSVCVSDWRNSKKKNQIVFQVLMSTKTFKKLTAKSIN